MFGSNSYMSVWGVQKGKGNYYTVRLSSSHKRKDTGNYETDFSYGFVRFAGTAADQIAKYDGMDSKDNGNKPIARIRLGNCGVTNSYDKEKNVTYWNPVVFSFEDADSNGGSRDNSFMDIPDGSNEELPFA